MEKKATYKGLDVLKFVIFALFGIFMFFVPIKLWGKSTIPIDHIVTLVKKIPNYAPIYSGLIVIIGAILPFFKKHGTSQHLKLFFLC